MSLTDGIFMCNLLIFQSWQLSPLILFFKYDLGWAKFVCEPAVPHRLQRFKASAAEKQKGKRWLDCKGSTAETEKNKVREESRRRLLDFSPTLQLTTQRLAGITSWRWTGDIFTSMWTKNNQWSILATLDFVDSALGGKKKVFKTERNCRPVPLAGCELCSLLKQAFDDWQFILFLPLLFPLDSGA